MPVDYEDLLQDLLGLSARMRDASGREPTEDEVWRAYAGMERLAAVLKLRMGIERPGVLLELPRSKNPSELVAAAVEDAERAAEQLRQGDLQSALESIRASRTKLRGYLAEKHRGRMREKRRAAVSRRDSSQVSSGR